MPPEMPRLYWKWSGKIFSILIYRSEFIRSLNITFFLLPGAGVFLYIIVLSILP